MRRGIGKHLAAQRRRYRLAASSRSKVYFENKKYLETVTIEPSRGTIVGRTLLDGKTVHVHDVQADPDHNISVAVNLLGGFRTVLGVPLLREGVPIGVIALVRSTVRPFTEKQIELVETFADQAVIAIENTHLFDEVQARTRELSESLEQQTATSEVLKVISSSPGELEPVFEAMLANATRICEAGFGNLFLREGPIFRSVAVHSKQQSHADSWRRNPVFDLRDNPGGPLDHIAKTKQVVHIPDLRTDQSYIQKKNKRLVSLVEVAGARTLVTVPMLKEGELIGAINMYRQEVRPFTDKQIELVKSFAAQAVIAIENTRLLNELRHRTDDLSEAKPWRPCRNQDPRQRHRHSSRSERENIQPVLHDQACGGRDRAWPLDQSRHHRQATWRLDRGRHAAGRVHRASDHSAARGCIPTQCALKSAVACSRLAHKLRSTSNFLAIST